MKKLILKIVASLFLVALVTVGVLNYQYYNQNDVLPAGSGIVDLRPKEVPFYIFKVGGGLSTAASGQVTIPFNSGDNVTTASKAYADSQIDTVLLGSRERGLSGLAFGVYTKDSVSLTNIVIRRFVGSALTTVAAGDTLLPVGNAAYTYTFVGLRDYVSTNTTLNNGNSTCGTITLAPLADQYVAIVKYAGSANGVTQPTATYQVIRQYSK